MSLAAETREAVRARPFLHAALQAGVVNYTAAARYLDVGDPEPVAAALRRYAEELPTYDSPEGNPRLEMHSGVAPVAPSQALLTVGGTALGVDGGDSTAIIAHGELSAEALEHILGRLRIEDISVEAAGVCAAALVVVVPRREGANALRLVERAFG